MTLPPGLLRLTSRLEALPLWKARFFRAVPPPLLLLLAAYVALRAHYWHIAPIWDSRVNYAALIYALQHPDDIMLFSVVGHICQGLFLFFWLPGLWFADNFVRFNIWLTFYSCLSIFAFYHLAALAAQEKLNGWELALCTALFAFHPTIISNMIHFNLDAGVLTFLLLYWLALWQGWRKTATFWAVIALFSKETAYLLVPLPFLFCWLLQPRGQRRDWLRAHWPVLALPYALLACFLFYKIVLRHQHAFWARRDLGGSLWTLLPFHRMFRGFHILMLMNFEWLLLLVWAGLLALIQWKRGKPPLSAPLWRSWLMACVLLGAVYAVTRVTPNLIIRYVMVLPPVTLLGVACLLPCIPRYARGGLCACLLGLLCWQDMRSVDPVAKSYFGTFRFGDHAMYNNSARRDEMVYNLQFLNFYPVISRAIKDIPPGSDAVVVTQLWYSWNLMWFNVNQGVFHPVMSARDNRLRLLKLEDFAYIGKRPQNVYAIIPPNCQCGKYREKIDKYFRSLAAYPYREEKIYDLDGYKIRVWHYSARPLRPPGPGPHGSPAPAQAMDPGSSTKSTG